MGALSVPCSMKCGVNRYCDSADCARADDYWIELVGIENGPNRNAIFNEGNADQ